MAFLNAKAKFEQAAANLQAKQERLNVNKEHALKQTELLQMKSKEIEEMRQQRAVDERERQARLLELANVGKK